MVAARIVVVESDAALRASLRFALEIQGFAVEAFSSGAELLGAQAGFDRDCLVLDHHPGRNDAINLLSYLRRHGCRTPAVITISNPTRAIAAAITRSGAASVEKPLMDDTLVAAIRACLSPAVEAA